MAVARGSFGLAFSHSIASALAAGATGAAGAGAAGAAGVGMPFGLPMVNCGCFPSAGALLDTRAFNALSASSRFALISITSSSAAFTKSFAAFIAFSFFVSSAVARTIPARVLLLRAFAN